MSEFQEGTLDPDQIIAQAEAASEPRAETAPAPEPQPAAAPTWNGKEWEFEANGQKYFPETRDQALTWMSQGRNYSQRMGELNKTYAQRMAEIEEQANRYKGYDRYSKIDEFARANPDWWEHVEKSYQGRETFQLEPQFQQVLSPILQRLQEAEGVIQEFRSEKERIEYERQDQALDSEIGEIRKQFPNIDLTSVDPASGETLELRVLKHAGQLGTQSFKAAFWDYFGPKLIEMSKTQALESAAKEKEANAKKGLLGTTPTPVKGVNSAQNLRGKSYDQLLQEGLEELGIANQ